ncbi:hypothetical protein [Aeromonas sp. R2-2]|uniref:hypothetical protein n=1 Tax=Aeromonas sp. R2-2 TaxID=3138460 RepID=UPI0034A48769
MVIKEMFKKLSIITCAIALSYYFWGEEIFPVEGTNHVMGVNLYKKTGLADCAYDGHDCSTVYSILPNGFERAIAGNNKLYLEAMRGLRDSFIFEERLCEVLQRKKIEFENHFISTSHLMALRCMPIEETSSKANAVIDTSSETSPAGRENVANAEETPTTQREVAESFWN